MGGVLLCMPSIFFTSFLQSLAQSISFNPYFLIKIATLLFIRRKTSTQKSDVDKKHCRKSSGGVYFGF